MYMFISNVFILFLFYFYYYYMGQNGHTVTHVFFDLFNLSDCHLTILLKFYGGYTPTSLYALTGIFTERKVMDLNLY